MPSRGWEAYHKIIIPLYYYHRQHFRTSSFNASGDDVMTHSFLNFVHVTETSPSEASRFVQTHLV